MTATAATSMHATKLRAVRRHLAHGVVVLTAAVGDQRRGMTADSFNLVSAEPPLITASVGATSRMHELLCAATGFGVSLLADDQADTATHFASRRRPGDAAQFASVSWLPAPASRAPVLRDALCWIDCRLQAMLPAGDHVLIVGEALHIDHRSQRGRPLGPVRNRIPALVTRPTTIWCGGSCRSTNGSAGIGSGRVRRCPRWQHCGRLCSLTGGTSPREDRND